MKKILALIVLSTLAGCALTPERQACVKSTPPMSLERINCNREASQLTKDRESLASVTRQCEGFGFTRGTNEFANCAMRLRQAEIQSQINLKQDATITVKER